MDAVGGDGCDERVQLILLLLQFLDEALDGPLGEALVLAALSVAHEAVHDAEAGIVTAGGVHRHSAAHTHTSAYTRMQGLPQKHTAYTSTHTKPSVIFYGVIMI